MTTATGVNVAVENQYRRIDHDHLTRGLAYAVGLDCRALVVVAEEQLGRRDRRFLRFNPGSASVSLDYPYDPASPTKTSIFVHYKDGQMTANRGYFEFVVPEEQVDEMDAQIANAFPGFKSPPFYPTAYSPEPAGVAAFAEWLIEQGHKGRSQ